MRQKRRLRRRTTASSRDDSVPIDLTGTARQIALFESGNGLAQGCGEILLAVVVALMLVPIRSFLRWLFAGRPRYKG